MAEPPDDDSGRPYGIILLTILFSLSGFVFLLMAVFSDGAPFMGRLSVLLFAVNGGAAAYGLWLERRWGWNLALAVVAITAASQVFLTPFAVGRSPSLMQLGINLGVFVYLYSVRERFGVG